MRGCRVAVGRDGTRRSRSRARLGPRGDAQPLQSRRAGARADVGAVPRLAEEQLDVADPALREPGLAVGEVQLPEPLEAVVVAEVLEFGRVFDERFPPSAQGLDVVTGDVLQVEDLEIRVSREP